MLKSKRADQGNIEVMRAFVRLRQAASMHADLARKLTAVEQKYDGQYKIVFDAIRGLPRGPVPRRRGIGLTAQIGD